MRRRGAEQHSPSWALLRHHRQLPSALQLPGVAVCCARPGPASTHHELGGALQHAVVLGMLHHAVHSHQHRLLHAVGDDLQQGGGTAGSVCSRGGGAGRRRAAAAAGRGGGDRALRRCPDPCAAPRSVEGAQEAAEPACGPKGRPLCTDPACSAHLPHKLRAHCAQVAALAASSRASQQAAARCSPPTEGFIESRAFRGLGEIGVSVEGELAALGRLLQRASHEGKGHAFLS